MNRKRQPTIHLAAMCWAGLGLGMCFTTPLAAQSYSPEHSKVQAMVSKGAAYLSQLPGPLTSYGGGTELLIAYALFKSTGDLEHPKVQAAIPRAVELARSLRSQPMQGGEKILYSTSVCAMFLADVDAIKYRPELESILNWLVSVQQNHGGYGYMGSQLGDTSQSQYAMLGFWTLHQAGLEVPVGAVENTLRYLRATIDPSGGWAYNGIISSNPPVPQGQVTMSLATAGAGAVLIGCDILHFFRGVRLVVENTDGVPAAFVRIDLKAERQAEARQGTLQLRDMEPVIKAAEKYQDNHGFSGGYHYYYWRYSQERFESFREIMTGRQAASPSWYNDGVTELAKLQETDGRWAQARMQDYTSDDICTCFAMLFLVRSTQKSIGKLDEGVAFGGYGLPKDVTAVRMVGNRIVGDGEASMQDLLTLLESENGSGDLLQWQLSQMQLATDAVARESQVARLARMLAGGSYSARRVAAKLLGRSEDLNQVPVLISALSDEDPYVPYLAEESLRLLSRKLSHPQMEVDAEPAQRKAAIDFWKQWYLGLRPEYIFIDR